MKSSVQFFVQEAGMMLGGSTVKWHVPKILRPIAVQHDGLLHIGEGQLPQKESQYFIAAEIQEPYFTYRTIALIVRNKVATPILEIGSSSKYSTIVYLKNTAADKEVNWSSSCPIRSSDRHHITLSPAIDQSCVVKVQTGPQQSQEITLPSSIDQTDHVHYEDFQVTTSGGVFDFDDFSHRNDWRIVDLTTQQEIVINATKSSSQFDNKLKMTLFNAHPGHYVLQSEYPGFSHRHLISKMPMLNTGLYISSPIRVVSPGSELVLHAILETSIEPGSNEISWFTQDIRQEVVGPTSVKLTMPNYSGRYYVMCTYQTSLHAARASIMIEVRLPPEKGELSVKYAKSGNSMLLTAPEWIGESLQYQFFIKKTDSLFPLSPRISTPFLLSAVPVSQTSTIVARVTSSISGVTEKEVHTDVGGEHLIQPQIAKLIQGLSVAVIKENTAKALLFSSHLAASEGEIQDSQKAEIAKQFLNTVEMTSSLYGLFTLKSIIQKSLEWGGSDSCFAVWRVLTEETFTDPLVGVSNADTRIAIFSSLLEICQSVHRFEFSAHRVSDAILTDLQGFTDNFVSTHGNVKLVVQTTSVNESNHVMIGETTIAVPAAISKVVAISCPYVSGSPDSESLMYPAGNAIVAVAPHDPRISISFKSATEMRPSDCLNCAIICGIVQDGQWVVGTPDISLEEFKCNAPVAALSFAECAGSPPCQSQCGNGVLEDGEECDFINPQPFCLNCKILPGYKCESASNCYPDPDQACFKTNSLCEACHPMRSYLCSVCTSGYISVDGLCVPDKPINLKPPKFGSREDVVIRSEDGRPFVSLRLHAWFNDAMISFSALRNDAVEIQADIVFSLSGTPATQKSVGLKIFGAHWKASSTLFFRKVNMNWEDITSSIDSSQGGEVVFESLPFGVYVVRHTLDPLDDDDDKIPLPGSDPEDADESLLIAELAAVKAPNLVAFFLSFSWENAFSLLLIGCSVSSMLYYLSSRRIKTTESILAKNRRKVLNLETSAQGQIQG